MKPTIHISHVTGMLAGGQVVDEYHAVGDMKK